MTRLKRFYVATSLLALVAIALGLTQTRRQVTAEAQPKNLPSFQTNFATWQAESPAQVVSITTTTSRFLGGVVVLNTGKLRLEAVQIGWALEGHTAEKGETFLKAFTTSYLPVAIEPGGVGAVRTGDWRTPEVLQYALDQGLEHFSAQAGIVGARFADGSTFTYNLAERKGFLPPQENVEVYRLLNLVGPETLSRLNKELKRSLDLESEALPPRSAAGDPVFKPVSFKVTSFGKPEPGRQRPAFCCRKTDSRVICAGSNDSCTVTPCTSCGTCPPAACSSSCACQVCDIVPNCG